MVLDNLFHVKGKVIGLVVPAGLCLSRKKGVCYDVLLPFHKLKICGAWGCGSFFSLYKKIESCYVRDMYKSLRIYIVYKKKHKPFKNKGKVFCFDILPGFVPDTINGVGFLVETEKCFFDTLNFIEYLDKKEIQFNYHIVF